MPITLQIDKSRCLIIHTVEGEFTLADVEQNRTSMLNDPDFDPSFDLLWDATMGTSTNLTSDQLVHLARSRVMDKTSRIAFVAPQTLVFGMARMFETYYSMVDNPAETRVFKNRTEALEWLSEPRTAQEPKSQL